MNFIRFIAGFTCCTGLIVATFWVPAIFLGTPRLETEVQKLNDAHRMNVENLKAINESLDKTARLQVGPGALGTSWFSQQVVRVPDGGREVLQTLDYEPPLETDGVRSFRIAGREILSLSKDEHHANIGPSIASICLDAPVCKTVIVRTPDGGWDIPKRKRERRADHSDDGYFYNRGEPPQPAQWLPGDVQFNTKGEIQ